MTHYPDLIGLLGVILILIAYFLLQTERIRADHMAYSLYNTLGSLMILYSLFAQWNLSAVVMEAAWLILSMYGLYKAYRQSKK